MPETNPSTIEPWLAEALAAVASAPAAVVQPFQLAARRAGRAAAPAPAGLRGAWTAAGRARHALLRAVRLQHGAEAFAAHVERLHREGDTAERIAVLRAIDEAAIDGLPGDGPPDDGPTAGARGEGETAADLRSTLSGLLLEDLRANEPDLVAAALGPAGRALLSDADWRQAVVKLVFLGVPLDAVDGLEARADDELRRMAVDLADERRAAGRAIPSDLDRIRATARPGGPISTDVTGD